MTEEENFLDFYELIVLFFVVAIKIFDVFRAGILIVFLKNLIQFWSESRSFVSPILDLKIVKFMDSCYIRLLQYPPD